MNIALRVVADRLRLARFGINKAPLTDVYVVRTPRGAAIEERGR
ncbi:MAG: hypothetical protein ACXV49_03095 [Halobacteriota archaeon]